MRYQTTSFWHLSCWFPFRMVGAQFHSAVPMKLAYLHWSRPCKIRTKLGLLGWAQNSAAVWGQDFAQVEATSSRFSTILNCVECATNHRPMLVVYFDLAYQTPLPRGLHRRLWIFCRDCTYCSLRVSDEPFSSFKTTGNVPQMGPIFPFLFDIVVGKIMENV